MTMKNAKQSVFLAVGVVLALLSLGLVACGDDDDHGGGVAGPGSTGSNATKSSGGSSSGGGASAPGSGSEKAYVADLCKASKDFQTAMTKLTSDPSKLSDQNAAMKAFAEPFENFANAVSRAKPPSDVKDYHNQVVKALQDVVAKLKKGDPEALNSLGDTAIPTPPASLSDKYDKLAKDNKDCANSGLFGE